MFALCPQGVGEKCPRDHQKLGDGRVGEGVEDRVADPFGTNGVVPLQDSEVLGRDIALKRLALIS